MIIVEQTGSGDPLEFTVTVRDGSSETHHRVTLRQATYQKLTGGTVAAERCVEAAFAFLLERESKESILSQFDITVIGKYFPSFEREFGRYLQANRRS